MENKFFKQIINNFKKSGLFLLIVVLLFPAAENFGSVPLEKERSSKKETINFTVTVIDKSTSTPLQYVTVIFKQEGSIAAKSTTNPFGRAIFEDLEEGNYILQTYLIGYKDYIDSVQVDSLHQSLEIKLSEISLELNEVVVKENRVNNLSTSIDVSTGRQTFDNETYHASPASTMTELIVQNLAGVARAPTGEVHIRGQHGEFTYLIDGIPIPLGVFGGLNEIVDPKVISNITFYTAGFPAEYGGQIAGLMDVQNRVPAGGFHLDISTFAGSYLTSATDAGNNVGNFKALNSNGQSLSFSNHYNNFGYFIAASRQETDRRIDQPVNELFHDHGFDYFTFGKFDYLIGQNDYLTANLNYSRTQTQVPYDTLEGIMQDDQGSYNAFQTLSYFHTYSAVTDKEENLFIGGFAREGGLNYTPNVVEQNRTFTTLGLRTKYDKSFSHHFKYAVGGNYSYTYGTEDFRFFDSTGDKLRTISNYHGSDLGLFAQAQWHPYEWTRLEFGLRYDLHNAPQLSNQTQFSPRAKWYFFIDEFNTISISYDRLFMPTNIENLGAVAAQFGGNNIPTLPERDNLYEVAYQRNWANGFTTKLAGFHKDSSPGLDDETLGSSTIRVNVNINEIKVTGIELALTYTNSEIPFSGYVNSSLIHAYGQGPVSGGFLPADSSTKYFDLDHDQRLSMVIGLNYQPNNWFVNLNAIYGSGLTNGNDDITFKTGLFDFNQAAHTTPSWILNMSGGYTFKFAGGHSLEPSLYISNLLDYEHLIKGAFFSGASYEERRNVVLNLTYHY
jgi:hypothetical protein